MTAREELLKRLRPRIEQVRTESLEWINVKQVPVSAIMGVLDPSVAVESNGSFTSARSQLRAMVDIALLAICDIGGETIFNEDDRAALEYLPMDDLKTISDAVIKMARMTDDGIDELAGN